MVDIQAQSQRARWLYFTTYTFSMFGSGLWLPLNAVFLTEQRHLSTGQVGLFYTVVALAAIVSNLVAGSVADRYGSFIPFLPAALVQGIGILILLLVGNPTGVFLSAVVSGLGGGAFFATQAAVLKQLFGPAALTRIFGLQFQLMNLAVALGAAALGLMVTRLGYAGYVLGFGVNAISYMVHGLNVCGPVRRAAGVPINAGSSATLRPQPWAPYLDRSYLPVIAVQLCIVLFGYAQLEAVIPVVFRSGADLPLWAVSAFATVNGLVIVLAQPRATAWVLRRGHKAGLHVALAVWIISTIPAWVATHAHPFSVRVVTAATFAIVFALGEVFISPSMYPLATNCAPPERVASYTAAVSLAYSLGLILGPAMLLPVFALGSTWYWLAIALGCAAGSFAITRIGSRRIEAVDE